MSTRWQARPRPGTGPLYLRLADGIARDIETGVLPDGWRLPTVRAVAHRLNTTPGTVARAYAELSQRGLTSGEAGRGTFVRPSRGASSFTGAQPDGLIDMSGNYAAPPDSALLRELGVVWAHGQLSTLVTTGTSADTTALGTDYLAEFGLRIPSHEIIATSGGQHALFATLAALTRHGDRIAVDELANPGVRAAAQLLRLRPVPIAHDAMGMRPDALAAAPDLKVVVTSSTLHNPTGVTMPASRRAELAATLATRHLTLIEDDPFAPLADPTPAISALVPDRSIYLASTSKAIAPGLRLAFISCPPALHDALIAAVLSSAWTPSSLVVDLVRRWLRDGLISRLATSRRAESHARLTLLRTFLTPDAGNGESSVERWQWSPGVTVSAAGGAHAWIDLPDEWSGVDVAALARSHGVAIAPASEFGGTRPGFRLGLGAPLSRQDVANGLTAITHMLVGKDG